jgi:indolepyruvate ferredoxin oxidoreductase beta subunit
VSTAQPIKIAILAMGGEGGGVLADWIVALAEHQGYVAQATSVPGVAQRTGATIYYVELFPRALGEAAGATPVLALMPLPGDVDIVIASELMEAGRAVQRGLVTPERTTLIASTHRVYAIAEKVALGDGRADDEALLAHARGAAKRFVGFDMARLAEDQGSVISAVLFGALAATGVLPFDRSAFEATVERGGVAVRPSLAAFGAAFARAGQPPPPDEQGTGARLPPAFVVPRSPDPLVQLLLDRAASRFGAPVLPIVVEGLRRLVDYQDAAYAATYLDRLDAVHAAAAADEPIGETARHLALWMSYEDTIRVADLKTRGSRFERVRGEVRVQGEQLLAIHEYLHPRLQELADTLPAALGRRLLESGAIGRWLERRLHKGRIVQASSLRGFLLLRSVAALRRWRRKTLRFAAENQRIEQWLADIRSAAARDPALATEIARCQRLVKGYGSTHERGWRNFAALAEVWRRGAVPAQTLARLRGAALADEHGDALRSALAELG